MEEGEETGRGKPPPGRAPTGTPSQHFGVHPLATSLKTFAPGEVSPTVSLVCGVLLCGRKELPNFLFGEARRRGRLVARV